MGKEATQGAVEGVKNEAAKSGSAAGGAGPAVQQVTGSAVQGTLDQLGTPEQQARLRQLIGAMVAETVDTAARRVTRPAAGSQQGSPVEVMTAQATHALATSLSSELSAGLGTDGRGPLGAQLAAASQGITASAVRGMS